MIKLKIVAENKKFNPLGRTEGSLNLSTTLERFLIDIDPSRRTYGYLKIKNMADIVALRD